MSAHGEHHVMPMKTYYAVYGALLLCTGLTYAVSELGGAVGIVAGSSLSIAVAMAVALTKAFLVAAWFMHLKYDTMFNIFTFVSALWFMCIFFAFTMFDLGSRDSVDEMAGNFELRTEQALETAGEAAP